MWVFRVAMLRLGGKISITSVKWLPSTLWVRAGDLAARALFGYDFNEFFAIELGFTYFRGDEITATDKITGAQFYSQNMKAYAIDLVGKIALPLDNGFRLYTKFGAQYFHSAQAPLFFDVAPFIVDDPDRRTFRRSLALE